MLASRQLLWCLFSCQKFHHHTVSSLGFSHRFCSVLIKAPSEMGSSLPFSHIFPYLWLAALMLEPDSLAAGSTSCVILRIHETPNKNHHSHSVHTKGTLQELEILHCPMKSTNKNTQHFLDSLPWTNILPIWAVLRVWRPVSWDS